MPEWKRKAIEWFSAKFDKVLTISDLGNCLQATGNMGGDVLTFRYYKNGAVTER